MRTWYAPVGQSIRECGSRLVPNDIDAISIDISISISISINADTGSNVTHPVVLVLVGVAPSGTACKRIYESTYALPVGRKRRAASAMKRWTLAGCVPASSVSHLLYLNTVALASRGNSFAGVSCRVQHFLTVPRHARRPVTSADTLRDSIKNDREVTLHRNALFILITSMVVTTRRKIKRSSLSLSKVRRGLTRARIPPGIPNRNTLLRSVHAPRLDTPLKASESSVPGQCDLVDPASRIPKRIAELTYLTFVKPGAVDTTDFLDPPTGFGLGNNDNDEKPGKPPSDVEFPAHYTTFCEEARIRFRSWRVTLAIARL
ncbi:hypothetical protein ALC57_05448 [Trachymyrmex cornetzi]|uniref:Uncharacterized protein n=1 Tax=Trachymyrmex cornetzi TaxID=471704 RepID=A0A195EAM9_9HYME|nr:hypothetical protein ALC57_05448 [Trachymyrmex cornetzi]